LGKKARTRRDRIMGEVYAYCRFFPGDDEESQIITMREMQVPEEHIFKDRHQDQAGKYPQYQKLLRRLKPGDLLYIRSFEAIGSSNTVVREQWKKLTKEKNADIVILLSPPLDTRRARTQYGSLMADTVASILDYIVEEERTVRKRRQKEGIEEARRQGVKLGRRPVELPENFRQICSQWEAREISAEEAARRCNLARTTFYHKAKLARGGTRL